MNKIPSIRASKPPQIAANLFLISQASGLTIFGKAGRADVFETIPETN
jgi:hypothetical protein